MFIVYYCLRNIQGPHYFPNRGYENLRKINTFSTNCQIFCAFTSLTRRIKMNQNENENDKKHLYYTPTMLKTKKTCVFLCF